MKISRFFPLVGIAIFAYLLLNIDIGKMLQILSRANIGLILTMITLTTVTVLLKAYKWEVLVHLYDRSYPLKDSAKAWTMGFSLSLVTPGRLGDLSRAYYVKDRIGMGKGLTTVIIDRVIDIAILFSLAILGFLSFVTFFTEYSNLFLTVSVLFVIFILAVVVFTKKKLMKMIFKPVFYKIAPKKHRSTIKMTFDEFYTGLDSVKKGKRNVILSIMIGVLVWIISIIQYYLLAMAISLSVPFLFLLSIMPIISLLDMLPISFSGIGTRDAAMILFFSFISIGKEYAISLSLLILLFGYFMIGLVGAAFLLRGGRSK
ncbi:MAG: lysylphosphatidylglycerol synthase transmembrane domain-containing protein [Candidatus Aenigmarchaeota archaeon]|nr:lysylphosphatidylglycerol synthase transmembrane domain-containing protein [Candidatus Aenigmarchaeota archaeon]